MPFDAQVLATTLSNVTGLADLLESVKLTDKLTEADKWCEEQGATDIADLSGYEEEFVESLKLKPIPKKKLLEALKTPPTPPNQATPTQPPMPPPPPPAHDEDVQKEMRGLQGVDVNKVVDQRVALHSY